MRRRFLNAAAEISSPADCIAGRFGSLSVVLGAEKGGEVWEVAAGRRGGGAEEGGEGWVSPPAAGELAR